MKVPVRLIVVIVLVLLVFPAGAAAQSATDGVAVVRAYIGAVSDGNVDAALAEVSDNVVVKAGPNPDGSYSNFTGKIMMRTYLQSIIADHPTFTITSIHADGDTIRFTATETEEILIKAGVKDIVLTGAALVTDGKVVSAAETLTPVPVAGGTSGSVAIQTVPSALPRTGGGYCGAGLRAVGGAQRCNTAALPRLKIEFR